MTVQQNIIKLNVSVGNSVVVEVGDTLHDLLEHKPSVLLAELPTLSHVVEQVTSWTQLHHDHMMFVGLERLQDLDVVGVAQRLQNVDLIHDFLLLGLLLHEIHVDALDGDQLPGQPMQPEVDLSEGTFAKHFTDLVELELSLRRLFILFEAVDDELANQEHFLGSRGKLARVPLLDLLQYVKLISVGSPYCLGQIGNVGRSSNGHIDLLRLTRILALIVDRDGVQEQPVHLRYLGLLLNDIVLTRPFDRAVLGRVHLTKLASPVLRVGAGRIRLHVVAVFLLFEKLVQVLLTGLLVLLSLESVGVALVHLLSSAANSSSLSSRGTCYTAHSFRSWLKAFGSSFHRTRAAL